MAKTDSLALSRGPGRHAIRRIATARSRGWRRRIHLHYRGARADTQYGELLPRGREDGEDGFTCTIEGPGQTRNTANCYRAVARMAKTDSLALSRGPGRHAIRRIATARSRGWRRRIHLHYRGARADTQYG